MRVARLGAIAGAVVVALTAVGGSANAQGVPAADLQLQMTTSPTNVEPGATFTYDATITNLGPDSNLATQFAMDIEPSAAATITAATPSVGSCVVLPNAVSCGTLGPLVVTGSVTVAVTVQVAASAAVGTVITGDAVVVSPGTDDPNAGNNGVIVTNTVVAPQPSSTTTTTTTTTTLPAATTTVPAATTTVPASTIAPATTLAATTTIPGALPATGSAETGLALAALAALAAGGSLIMVARRPRRTN